uniref:Alternative protein ELTD1 n=1 Tax=Homo sapiens TaxID=9606 RepID=L8EB43_HUMAN|nr:alternative protein ELTD1 [Homo sapiens]
MLCTHQWLQLTSSQSAMLSRGCSFFYSCVFYLERFKKNITDCSKMSPVVLDV